MKTKLLLLAMFISFSSFGQTIMYEPFNYALSPNNFPTANTTNQLIGQTLPSVGTWIAASSPNANFNDWIDSGTIEWSGMPTSTGNAFTFKGSSNKPLLPWATTYTTGKVYYSITMNVAGWGTYTPTPGGKQIFSLAGDVPSPIGTNPAVKYSAAIALQASGTGYQIGLTNHQVTTSGITVPYTSTVYAFDTQHFLVISYEISTGIATLYVDPVVTPGAVEPTTATLTTSGTNNGTATSVGGFYIRQDSNSATPITTIDEIRVARSWQEALAQAPLSVAKNEIEGLNIYPNPVSNGILYINSENTSDKTALVFDMLGRPVFSSKVVNGSINVSTLTKGNYVVKITEGEKTSVRKVVIE